MYKTLILHLFSLMEVCTKCVVLLNKYNMYKHLNIIQKIAIKEMCESITGISFNDLLLLFNLKEVIELIDMKLKQIVDENTI